MSVLLQLSALKKGNNLCTFNHPQGQEALEGPLLAERFGAGALSPLDCQLLWSALQLACDLQVSFSAP